MIGRMPAPRSAGRFARLTDLTHRWAVGCFVASAAALPWGSLQQVSADGVDLASLFALAGGMLTLPGIFADRLRVPFELVWPVLLLIAASGVRAVAGGEHVPWVAVVAAASGFLGAAHAVRHPSVSWAGPSAWALFAPVPVLLSAGASMGWMFPEGWSRGGQPLLGAPDLSAFTGTLLLSVGAAVLRVAVSLLRGKWHAILYLAPAMLGAGILAVMIRFLGWPAAEMGPEGAGFTSGRLSETLLLLYLGARMAAKLAVAARNRRDPELVPGALALLLGMPVVVLWPPGAAVSVAVAGGMLAGPAISRGADPADRPPGGLRFMTLVPLGLAALRLVFVMPGDPRDYAVRADRLVRSGRPDVAELLLRQVYTRVPAESRAMWQLAWLDLARQDPDLAAYWAVRALNAARSEIRSAFLAHPEPAEIQRFIDVLRDTVARNTAEGRPEGTLALGQVLLAAGRTDQALALLDALPRAESCPPEVPPEMARRLLAWLLHTPADSLPESLAPDALWTGLRAGAEIRVLPMPRELSGRTGVTAVAARTRDGWLEVLVISDETVIGGAGRLGADNRASLPAGAFSASPEDYADPSGWTWSGPLPVGPGHPWFVVHPSGAVVLLDPPGISFRTPVIHYRYGPIVAPAILLLCPTLQETEHTDTDTVLQEISDENKPVS